MEGYNVETGYWGLVEGKWMFFASEQDYKDYIIEEDNDEKEEI